MLTPTTRKVAGNDSAECDLQNGQENPLIVFEDFNIELIALVQDPEFTNSPKMKATQWNSRVSRSSTSSLARGLDPTRVRKWTSSFAPRSTSCGKMQCSSVVSRIFWLVGANQVRALVSQSRFFSDRRFFLKQVEFFFFFFQKKASCLNSEGC